MAGCLEDAAVRYGVSPLLLEAMALVESGGNPFAVNVKTKPREGSLLKRMLNEVGISYVLTEQQDYWVFSIFPETKEEAILVVKTVPKLSVTYDVGLMQVNKFWIDKYDLKPEWLLDECYAYKWGAFILANMIKKYDYSWEAVWHYNGRRDYAVKVFTRVKELCMRKYRNERYCKLLSWGSHGKDSH